jgi:DNA-binding LacI/PurR family transcriptional regulator
MAQVTTLQDVARLAGVSVATASAVLSGRALTRRIAHATAERVRSAALELSYHPNVAARALVKGSPRTLAFAVSELSTDIFSAPYSGLMAAGVLHRAQHHGFAALLIGGLEGAYLEQAMGAVEARSCDGVVMLGVLTTSGVAKALAARPQVPCVVIEPIPGDPVPRVIMRWDEGISDGVAELVAHGHRRGWWLESELHGPWVAQRRTLVQAIAARQGLELEAISDTRIFADEHRLRPEAPALLRARPAMVACNDGYALRLVRASSLAGLRVPQDFSVLGFDAFQSQHCVPQLGSVDHCFARMGMEAVDLLLELMTDPSAMPMEQRVRVVSARYVPGKSVAPPPR